MKTTLDIWEKHFGNTATVGLLDKRVEGFFEELNNEIVKEDEQKKEKANSLTSN